MQFPDKWPSSIIRAIIDRDCLIGGHVTIGGKSKTAEVPVMGNRVYIDTGAKILGAVTVGSDSVIGANAVVTKDVPSCCIVASVPARIIKSSTSSRDYY